MSNHLVSMTYKRKLGSNLRKSLMAILADKASDDGSGIYASKQTIADELDCSKRAVIETIKAFIADGLLVEIGQRKVTNGFTVEYAIVVDALEDMPLAACHAERARRKANPCTPVTGEPPARVNDVHLTGEPGAPKPLLNLPLSVSSKPTEESAAAPTLLPEHIVEAWNDLAQRKGLPMVKKLTPGRRKHLRPLMRQYSIDDFTDAIDAIERSPFLLGENGNGWRADFDFLLQPSSFQKLIEGSYGQ